MEHFSHFLTNLRNTKGVYLIIFQCVYHLAANYTMLFKIRFKKWIQNMGRCLTAKEGLAGVLRYMFEIHGCSAVKGNQHNHISL